MRAPAEHESRPIRLVEFAKAFYIGGTEVQVLELLRGLPERYQIEVAVLHEVGPLMEQVWQLGFLPRTFPIDGSFVRPNALLQIARMAAWLRAQRAELVHVHDFYSTLIAVPAARLAGVKVIVGRLDLVHWHGKVRAAALAQLTRLADHVIANAEAVRRLCLREGVPPERITIIRNGLDLPRFDQRMRAPPDSPLPELKDAPVLVHVANMTHPVKRQEDTLQALRILRDAFGPVHALFVGDGDRRPALEEYARSLGVGELAHFLGFRKDGPAILARADVGVLPSLKEGLSNAVIEGMAARLPMVVTNVGGNPELVRHRERGLLVEPERPHQLAAALAELLRDRAAARRMGEAGRAFVERELTLEQLVANHDRLYRRVLGLEAPNQAATAA